MRSSESHQVIKKEEKKEGRGEGGEYTVAVAHAPAGSL